MNHEPHPEPRPESSPEPSPEPWLSGPLEGVSPLLMPAAHALLQSRGDLERHAADLDLDDLWRRMGGAPAVGFHLRHIAGSIDRLLAYAAGRALTEEQFKELAMEREPGAGLDDARELIDRAIARIDEAVRVIAAAREESLFEARAVGRAQLPTNVFGLFFHLAEHTQRHTGQLIATATILRGAKKRGREASGVVDPVAPDADQEK